ncbi:MAG TPA: hypothetical protein VGN42_03295 [Pirellulales bacterium]|jgi:hypothetical protein|nr:hypothetical protein [Pirellulales bacterium]
MSTRGAADILFCLDASASMQPCFDAVRRHVGDFIAGLQSNQQVRWDWRIDFVAHRAGEGRDGFVFNQRSLYNNELLDSLYSRDAQQGRFFTTDVDEFSRGLAEIRVSGDEAPLVALDSCLDFPWRATAACHRVVILMTDEAAETGVMLDKQRQAISPLIDKIQRLRVLLFIVAPQSQIFDQLAQADKSEYEIVSETDDGLSQVDFQRLLAAIGKSVSVSSLQAAPPAGGARGLFGQELWGESNETIRGA